VPPLGDARSVLETLSSVAAAMEQETIGTDTAVVFAALAGEIEHFAGKSFAALIAESAPITRIPS